jgi:hypothetical protein
MIGKQFVTALLLAFFIQLPWFFSQKKQPKGSSKTEASPCQLSKEEASYLMIKIAKLEDPRYLSRTQMVSETLQKLQRDDFGWDHSTFTFNFTYKEVPCEGIVKKDDPYYSYTQDPTREPGVFCCIEAEGNRVDTSVELDANGKQHVDEPVPGPLFYAVMRYRWWLYKTKDNEWHEIRSNRLGIVGKVRFISSEERFWRSFKEGQ